MRTFNANARKDGPLTARRRPSWSWLGHPGVFGLLFRELAAGFGEAGGDFLRADSPPLYIPGGVLQRHQLALVAELAHAVFQGLPLVPFGFGRVIMPKRVEADVRSSASTRALLSLRRAASSTRQIGRA